MISHAEAMKAVERMELMAFFSTVSEGARALIAEELMEMINWPPDRPLRNGHGELIPYVEPRVRLDRLMKALKKVKEWPGMAEIRGLYCRMYRPADGDENPSCNIPGFSDEECASGVDYLSLERPPAKPYLPAPEDEPIGEDIQEQLKQLVAAKTFKGGK